MKAKVRYSSFAIVLTAVACIAIYASCIATIHNKPAFFTLLALYLILILCGLIYGPWKIEADPDFITIRSLLKTRRLAMRDVESVELFQPTMGAKRILGSGGFMGYWGLYKERDIGRYRAFYGNSSDCFLVRMKNGDKYILGCETPAEMVDYIKSQAKK